MTELDFYDGIRLIATAEALAVVVLVFVQAHLIGGWRTLDASNRFRLSGVALLAAVWGYGGIEAIIDGTAGSLRVILGAIALGYVALAYVTTVRGLCKEPNDG